MTGKIYLISFLFLFYFFNFLHISPEVFLSASKLRKSQYDIVERNQMIAVFLSFFLLLLLFVVCCCCGCSMYKGEDLRGAWRDASQRHFPDFYTKQALIAWRSPLHAVFHWNDKVRLEKAKEHRQFRGVLGRWRKAVIDCAYRFDFAPRRLPRARSM